MSEQRATGVRKPYKISKPREKWTEEEHARFVDAINTHGRDWKVIVEKVGTRTVAQVRSHAQKHFLKLEKTGNVDAVPPARAKRPSTKSYPVKAGTEDGSSASGQSTGLINPKRPRRTERVSTRPNRQEFTAFEEDPGVSPGPGSSTEEARLAEGKSSNNGASGTAESYNDPNGSVLSSQYRRLPSLPSIPSAPRIAAYTENMYSEYPKNSENTTLTDESSVGVITGHVPLDEQGYNHLYDVVDHIYNNPNGSAQIEELGSAQRQELVSRMSHLSDGLRFGLDDMPTSDSPPIDMNPHLDGPFTPSTYPQVVPGLPCIMNSPSPGLGDLDTLPDIPETPANTQGTGLLPLCTKPSELDVSGWKLTGLSGDLNAILPGSDIQYTQPERFDAHIFDY